MGHTAAAAPSRSCSRITTQTFLEPKPVFQHVQWLLSFLVAFMPASPAEVFLELHVSSCFAVFCLMALKPCCVRKFIAFDISFSHPMQ
jgi:hypothetical protein